MNKRRIERKYIYENQGDVIFVSGAVVSRVSGNTSNQSVLFESAFNGKAVFTGDDAQVGDIGSARLKQINYRSFFQRYKICLPINAVSSIKDGGFIEDGSTARLRV
jgi:hypothetical protein